MILRTYALPPTNDKAIRRRCHLSQFGNLRVICGHIGHTLGACGALEAWLSIEMLNHDWYAPTINLDELDPRCGELDYLRGEGSTLQN